MKEEYIKKVLESKETKISVYETVSSTNTLMKEKAKEGAEEFYVIIASEQTAGRGRMGRSFHSPHGTGLYMSILLRPKNNINPLYITTYAAVCTARVLERTAKEKAQIKWVNDIYMRKKKVCGILTESSLGENGYAVLGIGINVFEPQEGFPEDIKMRAGALFKEKEPLMREKIAAEIINEFARSYKNGLKAEMLEEYRERSFLIGKEIEITENGKTERAVAVGIDDEFALTVKKADGKVYTLNSGDVSIVI